MMDAAILPTVDGRNPAPWGIIGNPMTMKMEFLHIHRQYESFRLLKNKLWFGHVELHFNLDTPFLSKSNSDYTIITNNYKTSEVYGDSGSWTEFHYFLFVGQSHIWYIVWYIYIYTNPLPSHFPNSSARPSDSCPHSKAMPKHSSVRPLSSPAHLPPRIRLERYHQRRNSPRSLPWESTGRATGLVVGWGWGAN